MVRPGRTSPGDLPERDTVYALAEDHELEDLLFVGTEFGAYWTLTGGDSWHKIRGVPTIAVRDVEIQRRENDLVMATFGRSFYILDDYEIMRQVTKADLGKNHIFPIEHTLQYPHAQPRHRLPGPDHVRRLQSDKRRRHQLQPQGRPPQVSRRQAKGQDPQRS